jgi:DNA-binding beta-propeller fold protein YncE
LNCRSTNLESHFSLPFGVAISPDKTKAYVSASGPDEIAILDMKRLLAAGHPRRQRSLGFRLVRHGANCGGPQSPRLALSPDGSTLYVAEPAGRQYFDRRYDPQKVTGTIELGGPAEITAERRGERLFYTAKFSPSTRFRLRELPSRLHL